MKQPSTVETHNFQTMQLGSVDTATLDLLAAWKAEDATNDPEQLRRADEDVAAFKQAMNENRSLVGARPIFPRAALSFSIQARSGFLPIRNEMQKSWRSQNGCRAACSASAE